MLLEESDLEKKQLERDIRKMIIIIMMRIIVIMINVHDEDDCGGGGDVVFIITWNLSRVRNRIDCIVIVNGDGLLVIMSAHF